MLESYGRNVKVVTQACVGLVECIERGELNTAHTKALIQQYCAPLLAEGADTIVLGCTQYPFVRETINDIAGKEITLVRYRRDCCQPVKSSLERSGFAVG